MSRTGVLEEFPPKVKPESPESEVAQGIRHTTHLVAWMSSAVAAAEHLDPLLSECLRLAVAGAVPELAGWVWWGRNQRVSPAEFTLYCSPSPEQQYPANILAQGNLQKKTIDFRCFFACNRLEEIRGDAPLRKVVNFLKELFSQLGWSEDPPPEQE